MDKELICQDCHQNFTFTEGEQSFYEMHEFSEPKRCPDCRKKKKAENNRKPNEKSSIDNRFSSSRY